MDTCEICGEEIDMGEMFIGTGTGIACEECFRSLKPGKTELHHDLIAEKLDELSDLAEYWRRHRDKGRTPNAIRSALLMLANEVVLLDQQAKDRYVKEMNELCGPTAFARSRAERQGREG